MSTTPTDHLPPSDADIHRERTTFPHDLRLLHTLLSTLNHPIPLDPEFGPQAHDIEPDLPDMLLDMFCVVIYDYDIRNPADFEEMKDTAGLSEEHFQGIRKKLYPHLEEWKLDPEEQDYELLLRIDEIRSTMNIIEGMRDHGLKAPTFGLDDKVVRRDGGDSQLSAAGSDEIEFFVEGEMVEREPRFREDARGAEGEHKSEEQASAGKTEE